MDRKHFGIRGALAALAATTFALAAVPVPAQPGTGPGAGRETAVDTDGRDGSCRLVMHLARRLDLSDAQHEAIARIHAAGRARDLPLRKELRRLRHEMQGEMMKDAPSEKAVMSLADRIGDVRTNLQKGRLADRLAVRAQSVAAAAGRGTAGRGPTAADRAGISADRAGVGARARAGSRTRTDARCGRQRQRSRRRPATTS